MTRTPTKNVLLLVLSITICLWMGCGSSEMKDFSLDTIEAQSEARLKIIADTSFTLAQIKQYTSTRQQLDSLLYYAEWIKNYEENVALLYAQMAYDLATEENLNFPRGVSAYQLALLKSRQAHFGEEIEDAIVDIRISERLLSEYKRLDWEIHINNLIGVLYQQESEIDSALHYFNKALNQLNSLETTQRVFNKNKAKILQNLGLIHYLQDSPKTSDYYAQCDSLYQLLNEESEFINLWHDWAIYYQSQKDYHKADSLYNLCINYSIENPESSLLSSAYQAKGNMYLNQFYETRDFKYFDKTLSTLKIGLKYEEDRRYFMYENLGTAFYYNWIYKQKKSHIDSAALYYKLAVINAREMGVQGNLRSASMNLHSLCLNENEVDCKSILGDEAVFFINENYMALLDTVKRHSKAAFQRINKVEQRDIQVSAANKRKNQLYIGIIILSLVGATFLVLLQRQQNRRLKAEMEALRAQINPHFISNSLNAIESLVNLGNAKAAAKYLVHFSRLSRRILNGSRTATTSLNEELKTLKHFLALEQLRFRDKLTYDIQVAPEVNMDLVIVPAMILQPYVENAIWHGIKPKEAGGKIIIDVQKAGKKLRCAVEDNGIGRAKSNALRKASVLKHKSMGMQITEERLKGMGRIKGSQVEIEDLVDDSGNPSGTRIIIQFPYKLRKEKKN